MICRFCRPWADTGGNGHLLAFLDSLVPFSFQDFILNPFLIYSSSPLSLQTEAELLEFA